MLVHLELQVGHLLRGNDRGRSVSWTMMLERVQSGETYTRTWAEGYLPRVWMKSTVLLSEAPKNWLCRSLSTGMGELQRDDLPSTHCR